MDTLPDIAIAAPGRDTVDVTGERCARQRQQLLPGQLERLLHLTPDLEAIGLDVELGGRFIAEHRPFLREILARRETIESIRARFSGRAFALGTKEAGEIHR